MSLKSKIRINKTVIKSTVTTLCETWALTKEMENKLAYGKEKCYGESSEERKSMGFGKQETIKNFLSFIKKQILEE